MRSNLIDFSSTLPQRIAVVSVVVENFDDAGNLRRSFSRAYMSCLAKELLMQTRRFGRKVKTSRDNGHQTSDQNADGST